MINNIDALRLIRENSPRLPTEQVLLGEGLDRTLAFDIPAPIDMPPFDQSAMDGYALATAGYSHYEVVGTCKAGDHFNMEISNNQAIRIFTGAMTPVNCFAVVPQELVNATAHEITIERSQIVEDMHIRPQGEQIKKGEIALKSGTKLNAGNIGFLASLGIEKIEVLCRPRTMVITTGNELCGHDEKLNPGKIYQSNSFMLEAALKKEGIPGTSTHAPDELSLLQATVEKALNDNDLVLLTGGISAGDYDLVREALNNLGVETVLYKVAQKPGKPLFVGKKDKKMIFGLPGNPGAALTCFYLYVIPAIRCMQGNQTNGLLRSQAYMGEVCTKNKGLTHFLKASLKEEVVHILPAQSSAMLKDFGASNCLVVFPAESDILQKDEKVEIILLPE